MTSNLLFIAGFIIELCGVVLFTGTGMEYQETGRFDTAVGWIGIALFFTGNAMEALS